MAAGIKLQLAEKYLPKEPFFRMLYRLDNKIKMVTKWLNMITELLRTMKIIRFYHFRHSGTETEPTLPPSSHRECLRLKTFVGIDSICCFGGNSSWEITSSHRNQIKKSCWLLWKDLEQDWRRAISCLVSHINLSLSLSHSLSHSHLHTYSLYLSLSL